MSKRIPPAKPEVVLTALPGATIWSCTHFGRQSEIDVFLTDSGTWETVATVNPVAGLDAEDVASLIVSALRRPTA